MRITRNNDFIEYFLAGGREQKKCNNLYIKDNKLFSYDTVIAEDRGVLYINMTKYSTSTTRIQNVLLREAKYSFDKTVIVLDCIAINSQMLVK